MKKMKPSGSIKTMMASLLTLGIITSVIYYNKIIKNEELVIAEQLLKPVVYEEKLVNNVLIDETSIETSKDNNVSKKETITEPERIIVYDNMTMEELSDKLNKILSSDLSGMGSTFANYAIELGVDPYLAVAIAMHETGCTWGCSYLARECNNVGGQKGTGCGEYQAYDTIDAGIYGFILNIKNKYVDFGLLTAEEMNPKYAEDPMWAGKVNKYIEKIKNS